MDLQNIETALSASESQMKEYADKVRVFLYKLILLYCILDRTFKCDPRVSRLLVAGVHGVNKLTTPPHLAFKTP